MKLTHEQREIDIYEYVSTALNHWRVWVGTAIAAVIAATIWTVFIAPVEYSTTTSIIATGELLNNHERRGRVIEALPIALPQEAGAEAELCREILGTQAVRAAVIQKCQLMDILRARGAREAEAALARRTEVIIRRPGVVALKVTLPGPRLVRLARSAPSAQETKKLVVRVATAYTEAAQDCLSELRLTAAKRKRVFLERRKQEVGEGLAQAESTVRLWEAAHRLMRPELVGKLSTEELIRLQQAQEEARVEAKTARRRIASLRKQQEEHPEMEPASVVRRANPVIVKMRERLIEFEAQLAIARHIEGKAEQHPEVRAIREELASAQEALAEAEQEAMLEASTTEVASPGARRVREDLLAWLVNEQALEARIQGMETAMRRAEESIVELSGEALEYGRLIRTAKIKERLFETLAAEYEQALIDEQASEPGFYVLDAPVLPERPVGPSILAKIALAGLLGGLVGWVWVVAFGGAYRDKSGGGEREE